MAEVVEVGSDWQKEVATLLHEDFSEQLSAQQWQSLFDFSWRGETGRFGYALIDSNKAVGFLGALPSERTIAGKSERFCNISVWFVLPEFRRQSLAMLFNVLRDEQRTFTSLTPITGAQMLLYSLGFERLETERLYIDPRQHVQTFLNSETVRVLTDPNDFLSVLTSEEQLIFDDHKGLLCTHMVFVDRGSYCYLIFRVMQSEQPQICEILFVSNPAFLERYLGRIAAEMGTRSSTAFSAIDKRLFPAMADKLPKRPRPRYFKSSTLVPEQIDCLYSELVLVPE